MGMTRRRGASLQRSLLLVTYGTVPERRAVASASEHSAQLRPQLRLPRLSQRKTMHQLDCPLCCATLSDVLFPDIVAFASVLRQSRVGPG